MDLGQIQMLIAVLKGDILFLSWAPGLKLVYFLMDFCSSFLITLFTLAIDTSGVSGFVGFVLVTGFFFFFWSTFKFISRCPELTCDPLTKAAPLGIIASMQLEGTFYLFSL